MKIKILEYQAHRSNKVKVKSHSFRKGKWVENKKFEFHRNIAHESGKYGRYPIMWKKEYTMEECINS